MSGLVQLALGNIMNGAGDSMESMESVEVISAPGKALVAYFCGVTTTRLGAPHTPPCTDTRSNCQKCSLLEILSPVLIHRTLSGFRR